MPTRTPSNAGKTRGVGMNQSGEAGQSSRKEDLPVGGTKFQEAAPPLQGRLQENHAGLTTGEIVAEKPINAKKLHNPPPRTSNGPSSDDFASTSQESANNASSKPMLTSRRRQSSIPNAKAPQGPRPLDGSMGKRAFSNSVLPNQFNAISGASAVASHDPYTHELSINDISRFSFASLAPQKPPSARHQKDSLDFDDFLSPLNFDDFHTSITSTEPNLSHFPLPGRGGVANPTENKAQPSIPPSSVPVPSTKKTTATPSLGRKNSNGKAALRADQMSNTATSILRGRRQSHFPPNSFNNGPVKAPRKSVGPGTFLPPDAPENISPQRMPSVGSRKMSIEKQKETMPIRIIGRDSLSDDARPVPSSRALKAKSVLEPGTNTSKERLSPSRTPDAPWTSSSGKPATPSRFGRSGTPGQPVTPGTAAGSNRRMSLMPPHAKGLGARTISPTDARRMRRMSTMPQAPPLPPNRISQPLPAPQSEVRPPRPRSTAQSPGLAARKSVTPSSSRTTPDPNRKSYSSGQSLSSSTSYGSARNSTSMPIRLQLPVSSSRLPTPKPRLETNVATEEEVPPVPAIPKAYESPASEIDQPFFSARSSSLPAIDTPTGSATDASSLADAMMAIETPRAPSTSSRRSGLTHAETEPRLKPPPAGSKKFSQSIRLPPLNLLPLSAPTASKLKAVQGPRTPTDDRDISPPSRNNVRTPSTPLTASKATFFSRIKRKSDEEQNGPFRSSTSHQILGLGDELRPPSSGSPSLPPFAFEGSSDGRRNISPFISTSLPKSSGEFPPYLRQNFGAELNRGSNPARPNGPRAPSFSVTPKADKPSPIEPETIFSTGAIRRKLSRKRSESTTREPTKEDVDASKYDNMPPPKLPASATWGNLALKTSSPTQQKPGFLKSRRKTSSSSVSLQMGAVRQDSFGSIQSTASEVHIGGEPSSITMHSNWSGSALNIVHNLSAHKSNSHMRNSDSSLDRDDLIAEEEMKKLASKRRDFETAARELDTLRKRAHSVQSISPSDALQSTDLNIFERGEIIDFPDVYFTGARNARKIVGDLSHETSNFGYDDERGDYNIIEGDHLAYRYEVVDILGKGSFGQVVRCVDHKTGILVAVKIIRNKKRFHQQALVEVNILQRLREWDPLKKHSVVAFDQSFYFRGHLCISTDLLGMNLYEFIKAHDFRGFSLKLIRRFTKQLLASLVLLHGHKVIHCDLKPENVLLAHPKHSEIKVIDFGSSCFENEKVYTYIQSRFYRSPEVILGMSYGMPIDMWSLGCILAELYTGYPIFPGENEQEQLACIMEVFGPPEKHLIEKCSRKKLFFDSMGKPRLTVSSKGRRRRPSSKELRQVLKCEDEAFLDFIARCLRWDPARRMNPHEANMHEFITGVKMNYSYKDASRKQMTGATNSPVKRMNSVTANGGVRPLPQPPGTGLKNGMLARQESLSSSPNKRPIRQFTINGLQPPGTAKRASHVAMTAMNTSSARTAAAQKPAMGSRTDLAAAAAAASLAR